MESRTQHSGRKCFPIDVIRMKGLDGLRGKHRQASTPLFACLCLSASAVPSLWAHMWRIEEHESAAISPGASSTQAV